MPPTKPPSVPASDAEAGTLAVSTPAPVDAHEPPATVDATHLTVYEVSAGLPTSDDAVKGTTTVPLDGDVAVPMVGADGALDVTVTALDAALHAVPAELAAIE